MNHYLLMGGLLIGAVSIPPSASAQTSFVDTLLPKPAKIVSLEGSLAFSGSFSVRVDGFSDSRLTGAIQRLLTGVENATGTPIAKEMSGGSGATLVVDVRGGGQTVQSIDEDETYSLTVTSQGARLKAATVVGAMHGMQTFLQLLQTNANGYSFPAVQIDDAPRFRWRGLMMDCGRHFEPVEVIKRTLDGMAAVKLNVFHWHLSDDQGFRIESKVFPKLTAMGSDGLFYTQEQAREVIAYARERGIRVVPEFDMPGHSRSWFVGYPNLSSAPGPYTIRREFGIDDAAMDPTRATTYEFLGAFLGEMAEIFPDPYIHIGGDESDGVQWKANPSIQAFMQAHSLKDGQELQAYFNQRLYKILENHHKRMIGWDEVLNPALPKEVTIQSWRGEQSLMLAAKQGYAGILSQPYYLDGMKSAEEHYMADPLPSSADLTAAQRDRVLGGEICMWAEQVNERSIDSRIWPRSAAIAERFWSREDVRDADDMYRRLAVESLRLEALGLTHLSHKDAALRELAGNENIDDLRVLASILEPVSFSERYQQQHTNQLTPLINLVDAVRPDPLSRSDVRRWTHQFLRDPLHNEDARASLEQAFRQWKIIAPAVRAQMSTHPLLAKAKVMAERLPGLADAGLAALQHLSSGTKAPAQWKQHQLALIGAAVDPGTLVRLTFLDSLKELVNEVQE